MFPPVDLFFLCQFVHEMFEMHTFTQVFKKLNYVQNTSNTNNK